MSEHLVVISPGEDDESRDLELAERISVRLAREYPGYPWRVSFTGHALVVRNDICSLALTDRAMREGRFGLTAMTMAFGSLLPRSKMRTVHEVEAECVRHGGALLEAFGLPRTKWAGEEATVPEDLWAQFKRRQQLRGWRV